jgi:hypothetical protein
MALRRAGLCARCGRDVRGLPDVRREGGRWFCSQSCFLQHVSASTHSGGSPPGSRRRSSDRRLLQAIRLLGKTVKWAVILVVLATVALVIGIVVAVGHAVSDGANALDKAERNSHRAALAYPHMKRGTTIAQVRRQLGKPPDTQRYRVFGVREVCWYYGLVDEYEFSASDGGSSTRSRGSSRRPFGG